MHHTTAEDYIESKRIELTVHGEMVDLANASDREKLVDRLKQGLSLAPDEDMAVLGSYPIQHKLLLQLPSLQADALVGAVKHGAFAEEGVVDAYICPSAPASEDNLGFERQPMVRWFTPIELVRAGVKAVLSTLFGSYADRREVQALQAADHAALQQSSAGSGVGTPVDSVESSGRTNDRSRDESRLDDLISREVCDFSHHDGLWIDYVADLGDGWDPTYTVARLLAEEQLQIPYNGKSYDTRRGQMLVMGGDQVYPTATREEYQNRLVGPYRAALPCVIGGESPKLFAVPGNHDWYDGLTSFTRLFCQQRWIGGWQTEQVRSYFAIKLPHDWWLWGIDVQLESDIDLPQFNYFETLARQIKPGSKIILCTAEPSWVFAEQKGDKAYQNLEYFERKIIRANDLELVVGLAGDLHTYARYEAESQEEQGRGDEGEYAERPGPKQRFVAGGGGAYLYPSHQLPEHLSLPADDPSTTDNGEAPREGYVQQSVFPDKERSRRLSLGALALPFKNWKFAGVLGLFYLLFAWVTQSATKVPFIETGASTSFIERLENMQYLSLEGIGGLFADFWVVLRHGPITALIVLLLFGGLVGFADKKGPKKVLLGIVHTAGHVVLALLLMWTFAEINLGQLGLNVDGFGQVVLFATEMLVVGSLLGGVLFGMYMLLSNGLLTLDREYETGKQDKEQRTTETLKGVHANEVFSSQSISDYKNFVRLQIREDGDLVIYPIGVEKVCTVWRFNSNAPAGEAWFDPEKGSIEDRASLIEEPIVVRS